MEKPNVGIHFVDPGAKPMPRVRINLIMLVDHFNPQRNMRTWHGWKLPNERLITLVALIFSRCPLILAEFRNFFFRRIQDFLAWQGDVLPIRLAIVF